MLFLSLFLVILINLIVTTRSFFRSYIYSSNALDYVSILPFFSLLISILIFFCYGFCWSAFIALMLTLAVLFTNIREFSAFCLRLKREEFSLAFIVLSCIETVLLVGFFVVLIVFCPKFINSELNQKILYSGNAKYGYELKSKSRADIARDERLAKKEQEKLAREKGPISEKTENAESENLDAISSSDMSTKKVKKAESEFVRDTQTPSERTKTKANVVFIPDIYVQTSDCVGNLSYLARKNYSVYAFSFYDEKLSLFGNFKDWATLEKFNLRRVSVKNADFIQQNQQKILDFQVAQYEKALKIMQEMDIQQFYILAEGNCCEASEIFAQNHPESVLGIYKINQTEELASYVSGFGNLNCTRPLEFRTLGKKASRNWENAIRISFYADKTFRQNGEEK